MKTTHDIYQHISAITQSAPNHKAVVHENNFITYRDLIIRADVVSCGLKHAGVSAGDKVAIYMNPGIERIVAMLAIVKLGAAYVPLDPIQPIERRNYICRDASVRCILVDEISTDTPVGNAIIYSSLLLSKAHLDPVIEPGYLTNLCYVMYTSGTTGNPKGVCISQKNIITFAYNRYLVDINNRHVFAHASNFSFDPSTLEIWVPLLNGATIVVLNRDILTVPLELYRTLIQYGINVLWLTSPILNFLFANGFIDFRMLDYLILGGESLSVKNMRLLADSPLKPKHIMNGFGPTETTVFSLYYEITSVSENATSIPIGKPLDNEAVYVLGNDGKMVEPGQSGELYIAGDGVGQGYLNPESNQKTAYKYIDLNGKPTYVYKTGDIVKQDQDGIYHFLGRMDNQVKINGYRIEPNEILNCIETHPAVAKTIMRDIPDSDGGHQFIAYVKLKATDILKVDNWKSVYENVYRDSDDETIDVKENFSGWRDSFNGKDFSKADMKNWLDSAVTNIAALAPRRVLEIGCGTGLLLFKLWERCEHYTGIDFSEIAVNTIKQTLKNDKAASERVSLFTCQANQLAHLFGNTQQFDVVVLNSVIQYFPDINYFKQVLTQVLPLLTAGGSIYVGDVRNYSLQKIFYGKKYESMQDVVDAIDFDNELCIAPDYFYQIHNHIPELTCKAVKQRTFLNPTELSLFRYDVILKSERRPLHTAIEITVVDCLTENVTVASLTNNAAPVFYIKNIMHPLMQNDIIESVICMDVRKEFTSLPESSFRIMPEILQQELSLRFASVLLLVNTSNPACYDALVSRAAHTNVNLGELCDLIPGAKKYNDVQAGHIAVNENDIYRYIAKKLPHYMLPKSIVIVPDLKMNINGKYDLSALPNPLLQNLVMPENTPAAVLGLPDIIKKLSRGRLNEINQEMNLISLGLDSLDFLSLLMLIEENFSVSLSLSQILKNPSVAAIQKIIDSLLATNTPKIIPEQTRDPAHELPLIPSQMDKYMEHQDDKLKFVNNLVYAVVYKNDFKLEKLVAALNTIYVSQPALRINILMKNNQLTQMINAAANCPVQVISLDDQDLPVTMQAEVKRLQNLNISLQKDNLFQCIILQTNTRAVLLIYFHHILLDLQSLNHLLKMLQDNYSATDLSAGKVIQENYAQHILQEDARVKTAEYKANIEKIALSLQHQKREIITDNYLSVDPTGDYAHFVVPFENVQALKKFASSLKITSFAMYMTIYQEMLREHFQQDNFTVGMTSSARLSANTKSTIALVNNYLVLPYQYAKNNTLHEKCLTTHSNILSVFEQIEFSHYDVLKELTRRNNNEKLFNTFFDYNYNDSLFKVEASQIRSGLQPSHIVNRILSFRITEYQNHCILGIRYRTAVFNPKVIASLAELFLSVLTQFVKSGRSITHEKAG